MAAASVPSSTVTVLPEGSDAGQLAVDPGQLTRRPGHAAVHDHGVERVVRRVGAVQPEPEGGQPGPDPPVAVGGRIGGVVDGTGHRDGYLRDGPEHRPGGTPRCYRRHRAGSDATVRERGGSHRVAGWACLTNE